MTGIRWLLYRTLEILEIEIIMRIHENFTVG